MSFKKLAAVSALILISCFILAACGSSVPETLIESCKTLTIISDSGSKEYSPEKLWSIADSSYESRYSVVNNWPTAKVSYARGIKVADILKDAGVYDSARTITFESDDGYNAAFTREQLEAERFYFPDVEKESSEDPQTNDIILAYEYAEGSPEAKDCKPCSLTLIFGQERPTEHNNPAFVENISKITVSSAPEEQWDAPDIFPKSAKAGESIKLQHKYLGLLKVFYTTDGSDPTPESDMYNPSTYQPELNKAITVEPGTTLKAIAIGYGKTNSTIAEWQF